MIARLYALAVGPLFWAAVAVFVTGMGWRVYRFLSLVVRQDRGTFSDFRPGWALAAVARYLLPLNRTVRAHPWAALAGYGLHLSLFALTIFASGHVVLWEYNFGFAWPALPEALADGLTILALACLAFLAGRRFLVPAWRGLSSPQDFLALALVALPLASGLAAGRHWGPAQAMAALHVLSAEALLAAIPFTKLGHMLFFFVSRAVTGSDFGKRQVGAW